MMHWQFPPVSRPRSPFLQIVLGMVGLALMVGIGLFALGALAVIVVTLTVAFAIRRAFSPQPASAARPAREPGRVDQSTRGNVIDGEFEVVNDKRHP